MEREREKKKKVDNKKNEKKAQTYKHKCTPHIRIYYTATYLNVILSIWELEHFQSSNSKCLCIHILNIRLECINYYNSSFV